MPVKKIIQHVNVSLPRADEEKGGYKWLVLSNVMIGTFMAVLDSTILNVGLSNIMNSFGTSLDMIEWVLTAYMLVMAVMLPASGWVADHLGYKRTYILALFLFTFGSWLCGLAWNETILIIFRIIQGCGAGMLMPTGMAIVTRTFPPNERGMALGFWGISSAASVSLGPLIGGYLIDNFSWHSLFYVNVPVGIFGLIATIIIQKEYRKKEVRSFDVIGAASMAVFLTFLLLALSCGNSSWNTGGWNSTFIKSSFFVSFVGMIIFIYVELNVKHPLIELRLLKNMNFALTNLVLFIFGFGMFGSTFLLPYYLENGLSYTAFQAGMVYLPVGLLQAVSSPIAGVLSDRINPKIPAVIGVFLIGLSLYLNSYLSLHSESMQIYVPLIIRGVAMGLAFAPLSSMAMSKIPREQMAQASGILNVIRQVGGSFGVAVLGTLLTRQAIVHAANFGQSVNQYSPAFQNTVQGLKYFVQSGTGKNLGDAVTLSKLALSQNLSSQAFVQAICDDFLIGATATMLCIVPLLFVKVSKK